jgi:HAE1 family hydrophobic/amphiphilic exporter-1
MNITKISIKRPTLVVVIFAILSIFGIFAYQKLNQELLPKFSPPIITVSTIYPGASPSEVENSLTRNIEDAVSSLEGVDKISSTSMESFSLTTIELKVGSNVDLILQDAQRKINAVRSTLPDNVEEPTLGKFDFAEMPILNIGATSNLESTEFYDLMDNKIKPMFERIPGVARVQLVGGNQREIQVNLNQEKLKAYGLSILQVSQIINGSNLDFPTGKVNNGEQQTLIRLSGKYKSVDELQNLVIKSYANGSLVKLKDIAEVKDSEKDPEIINRINVVNSIGITIQKQSDANAVKVSEEARKTLANLSDVYKDKGVNFTIAQDSSQFTLEASSAVIHDLIIAVILVSLVMLLFLHSLRNAFIVMVAIPASLVATFIVMYVLGFTLNLMSLLGLSLVVGILVDDAIVVIENIYRHMEMGKNRVQASYDGLREIGATVTSITLVIVVVFVPIALTDGLIADLLRQFAVVVASATLLSLFIAFTLIPLLASRFSKLEHISSKNILGRFILAFEKFINRFSDGVTSLLKWSFNHKVLVLTLTILTFFSSIALVPMGFIGSEFVSSGDRGEFIINLELPKNATIEETNLKTFEAEHYIKSSPIVSTIFTKAGTSSDVVGGRSQANMAEINVKLVDFKDRSVSTEDFSRSVKATLQRQMPGIKFTAIPVSIMGTANQAPIQVNISGDNIDSMLLASEQILNKISKVQGIIDPKSSVDGGNPEISIDVDRQKMASLGISLDMLGASLQTAYTGNTDSKFRKGENEYDINIRLDKFDRKDLSDVENFSLINSTGEQIKLKQFAHITESEGPSRLERKDRVSSVTVSAMVIGRPSGTVGTEVQEMVNKMDLPESVSVNFGGDLKNQGEAFGSLGFALLISIVLVYLIMVALYDNYVYPFVVLFSIPLAMIGALLALALTMQTLSIFSILGIIMLIGLVAKNAILVVDFTNDLKKQGLKVKDALIKATQERFRPILMTTLAMVIGMLPIALAQGAGAEWKNGLAWVLIGGLTSSMFLTLIIVPIIYYLLDRILAKFGMDKSEEVILTESPLYAVESTLKIDKEVLIEN